MPFLRSLKKIILIILILTVSYKMEAQQKTTAAITGEYYLTGVMETASGFKLNPDASFEFFFSYGALDRSGSGTWEKQDNMVIFNSPKSRGQNFALVKNMTVDNDSITIKIVDSNANFLPHVYSIVKSGGRTLEALTDHNGEIRFAKQPVDSILLVFEFAPERAAVFAFTGNTDNYFEFRFEPWVLDVIFENFVLTLDGKELSGQHPLLKEGEYHFIKN